MPSLMQVFDHNKNVSISIDGVWFGRRDGDTPLLTIARSHYTSIYADAYKAEECIRLLLAHGADPTVRTPDGQTAADLVLSELSEEEQVALCEYEAGTLPEATPRAAEERREKAQKMELKKIVDEMVTFIEDFHAERKEVVFEEEDGEYTDDEEDDAKKAAWNRYHEAYDKWELACGDGCRFFASMALSGSRYSDEDCTGEYVSVEAVANSMVNAHNHGWVTRREWIVKHYEYVKDLEAALNKADKEICDTPCEYLEKLEKAQKDAVKERFEVEEDLRDAKKELEDMSASADEGRRRRIEGRAMGLEILLKAMDEWELSPAGHEAAKELYEAREAAYVWILDEVSWSEDVFEEAHMKWYAAETHLKRMRDPSCRDIGRRDYYQGSFVGPDEIETARAKAKEWKIKADAAVARYNHLSASELVKDTDWEVDSDGDPLRLRLSAQCKYEADKAAWEAYHAAWENEVEPALKALPYLACSSDSLKAQESDLEALKQRLSGALFQQLNAPIDGAWDDMESMKDGAIWGAYHEALYAEHEPAYKEVRSLQDSMASPDKIKAATEKAEAVKARLNKELFSNLAGAKAARQRDFFAQGGSSASSQLPPPRSANEEEEERQLNEAIRLSLQPSDPPQEEEPSVVERPFVDAHDDPLMENPPSDDKPADPAWIAAKLASAANTLVGAGAFEDVEDAEDAIVEFVMKAKNDPHYLEELKRRHGREEVGDEECEEAGQIEPSPPRPFQVNSLPSTDLPQATVPSSKSLGKRKVEFADPILEIPPSSKKRRLEELETLDPIVERQPASKQQKLCSQRLFDTQPLPWLPPYDPKVPAMERELRPEDIEYFRVNRGRTLRPILHKFDKSDPRTRQKLVVASLLRKACDEGAAASAPSTGCVKPPPGTAARTTVKGKGKAKAEGAASPVSLVVD